MLSFPNEFLSFVSFMASFALFYLLYRWFQKFLLMKFQFSEDGEFWLHSDGEAYHYPPENIKHRFDIAVGFQDFSTVKTEVYSLKYSWYFLSCALSGVASVLIIALYHYLYFQTL